MFKSLRSALVVYLLVNSLCLFASTNAAPAPAVSLPLAFEINRGQTAPQVQYLARSREGVLFFTNQGVTVAVPQLGAFRMLFENAATPQITAADQLQSHSNYLSHEPGKSVSGIENYGTLLYSGLYPGIDVKFYGQGRHLEHDFIVAPGANASQIALRMEGIDHVALKSSGELELTLGKAQLMETAPIAWQMVNGQKKSVTARWALLADNKLGISLGAYDHSVPLTIDPVLAYSTHLGGTTQEDVSLGTTMPSATQIEKIVLDPSGNIYVSGSTTAIDYPTTAGALDRTFTTQNQFQSDALSESGFISKFDKTGHILIYSTYLHADIPVLAVDASGNVYAAERANDTFNGPSDGTDFGIEIDKLSPDGSRLEYSFIFGATPNNSANCVTSGTSGPSGIAADNLGHVWISGGTSNPCMPTTPGVVEPTQVVRQGLSGLLAKFDTSKAGSASIVYATYIGSATTTNALELAVDSAGNAYVSGVTTSIYPHSSSFGDITNEPVYVTKFNPTATARVFSTLLGGVDDGIRALAIDSSSNVYLAGATDSAGFPTTPGALRTAVSGPACEGPSGPPTPCPDAFITKFNPTGSALVYSTLLGGSLNDEIHAIATNSAGMAFVTGSTSSTDFPVTANAFEKTIGSQFGQTFVTALNADGKSLYYSTFLGGTTDQPATNGAAIFVDPAWNAWVAGSTGQSDYPVTPDAFQPGVKGVSDGFIAKVVIAGDLRLLMHDDVSTVAKNGVVTFFAQVTDLGPDGSDNVVFSDPIPAGFSYAGILTNSASSCTTPAMGATTGTVTCKKTRLENGGSFWVNVYLRATAASGATLVNKASTSAQTQDLSQGNNSVSLSVHVQ